MKCPECHAPNPERTGLDDPDGFELECIACGYQFWIDEWKDEDEVALGYAGL